MTRIITYLMIYVAGMTISYAQVKSEDFLIKNGDIELPGTLTYTEKAKDLVIWVHGSGDVDRNGNQRSANIKANYIKQLRDELNKNDIAFFSYDKRTANPKNAAFLKDIVFDNLVDDAKKVVSHLKDKYEYKSITLVGHSQGSLVAMLAKEGVNKYISLAGPAESIDQAIVRQVTNQNAEIGKKASEHFKELKETGDVKNVNPYLTSIFAKQNFPFIRNWMSYNPTEEIKKVTIPTLIINGDKDIQVTVDDAKALHESNSNARLVIIENMNHVLKIIEKDSDNLPSYYSPDFKLSDKLVKTITEFVKK
ncbi:alpha/beta hydrolase [Pseudotenacibaculum sp. MALMAid0570]|uniref:alpha/beta hydrolase n=1 Tax=Pseudotenacibaculum sp. MALMAid0570 TaxID=3143938 RepID=UPI0032DF32F2